MKSAAEPGAEPELGTAGQEPRMTVVAPAPAQPAEHKMARVTSYLYQQ